MKRKQFTDQEKLWERKESVTKNQLKIQERERAQFTSYDISETGTGDSRNIFESRLKSHKPQLKQSDIEEDKTDLPKSQTIDEIQNSESAEIQTAEKSSTTQSTVSLFQEHRHRTNAVSLPKQADNRESLSTVQQQRDEGLLESKRIEFKNEERISMVHDRLDQGLNRANTADCNQHRYSEFLRNSKNYNQIRKPRGTTEKLPQRKPIDSVQDKPITPEQESQLALSGSIKLVIREGKDEAEDSEDYCNVNDKEVLTNSLHNFPLPVQRVRPSISQPKRSVGRLLRRANTQQPQSIKSLEIISDRNEPEEVSCFTSLLCCQCIQKEENEFKM